MSIDKAATSAKDGDWACVESICNSILLSDPAHADARHLLGLSYYQRGLYDEALENIKQAIDAAPQRADFYNNLGNVFRWQKRTAEALSSYEKAVLIESKYDDALYNLGNLLSDLGRYEEALNYFAQLTEIQPTSEKALFGKGLALMRLERAEEALACFSAAVIINPTSCDYLHHQGMALNDLERFKDALNSLDRCLAIMPDHARAWVGRGSSELGLMNLKKAVECYQTALEIDSQSFVALNNLANALMLLGKVEDAIEAYGKAIQIKPDLPDLHANRAKALREVGRFDESLESYLQCERLSSSQDGRATDTLGNIAHLMAQLCQWEGLKERVTRICVDVSLGRAVISPFALLSLVDNPALHKQAAEIKVASLLKNRFGFDFSSRERRKKIHIAYLSADYFQHATMMLMAGLFKKHDRSKFEISAISFGRARPEDSFIAEIRTWFDRFVDVHEMSDVEVAAKCRELRVEIAVDLKGFTLDSRPKILMNRCAPIQINWLGYPGTMGADFIDYIIADPTLIGEQETHLYTEKIIWMPETYQVNDNTRYISTDKVMRSDWGLPEEGFVFCCFNNSYKITPETFSVWMKILSRVPQSVLWLLESSETAANNLRKEAHLRGISPERLIFARRVEAAKHLARQRLADLFIDTWPYNAHTTASDALWVGLPLITRSGESFASRVGASLLRAIGLPELITAGDSDYEELAVALANDPGRLLSLRERLNAQRLVTPLFDTSRFISFLESAYRSALDQWLEGSTKHIRLSTKDPNLSVIGDQTTRVNRKDINRRIAVITPYYKEPIDYLRACHQSVISQAVDVTHFMIADGYPRDDVARWNVQHVELPLAHGDNGNTPRMVGSVLAMSQDFDFIAYLDADNWFHPSHLASLLTLFENSQANVCHSLRTFHDLSGEVLPISERNENTLDHVDTSCFLIHRSAFEALWLWTKMPKRLSPICDRVFFQGIKRKGFSTASTSLRTVAFRSQYAIHYHSANRIAPLNAKSFESSTSLALDYCRSESGRAEVLQRLGWVPDIGL